MRQGHHLDELLYGVGKLDSQKREIIDECDREKCRNHKIMRHVFHSPSKDLSPYYTYWHPSVTVNDHGKILIVYASDSSKGRAIWYQAGGLISMDTEDDEDPPNYYGSDNEQYLSTPPDD